MIVDSVAQRLGKDPRDLASRCSQTPLDHLRGAIAKMLAETATADALAAALEDLHTEHSDVIEAGLPMKSRYADQLARRLLQTSMQDVWTCFATFRRVLAHVPLLAFEQKKLLLEYVRPLWVHPAAASHLRTAVSSKTALALCGIYVNVQGPNKDCRAYTFERYLERAWYLSDHISESKPCPVYLARQHMPPEEIRSEIARQVIPTHRFPESEGARRALNRETIVLFVPALAELGGIPDPHTLGVLMELAKSYSKVAVVFACCEAEDTFPEGLCPITPLLDPRLEDDAYSAECAETDYLARNNSVGRQP